MLVLLRSLGACVCPSVEGLGFARCLMTVWRVAAVAFVLQFSPWASSQCSKHRLMGCKPLFALGGIHKRWRHV